MTPVFWTKNVFQARAFTLWIKDNFAKIKKEAEKTTSYGKLLRIKPWIIGRKVLLSFYYSTADAMGLNMIVIATDRACKYISQKTDIEKFYLRSNLSSDKKASFFNFIDGYGKEVLAEAIIPKEIITRYFNISTQEIYDFWHSALLGSLQGGMIGINAHFANGLAAIFKYKNPLFTYWNNRWGKTTLCWQNECLRILGCEGEGKAKKFAEIIGTAILAGEISIIASFATGKFAEAHIAARKRKIGR
ncbi:MAG: hypothetical protein NC820_01170 [Candidatus Omnitrophica bacterium]|nr:hypothetical protein [Candidatus Omnitrophota bacterium]